MRAFKKPVNHTLTMLSIQGHGTRGPRPLQQVHEVQPKEPKLAEP